MGIRLLLIEADLAIGGITVSALREEGFAVEWATDGIVGGHLLTTGTWDVILLDWSLPGVDGLALLQKFRHSGRHTPVMFVTGRGVISDRVHGLNAGADDYLCKPFAFEELLARIRALLRRPGTTTNTVASHADLRLDVATHRVERAGKELDLTAKEEALLLFFLRHPGEVLSHTRIYDEVWDERHDGLTNTLPVHVVSLRKKLEAHGVRLIHTVRGEGYSFGEQPKVMRTRR